MGLEFITHNGINYPKHEAEGNAARWIMPMALEYCNGFGFDIGANRKEWAIPGCFMIIDPAITPELHAMVIPCEDNYADYIFSSHCLEHVKENWYDVLDYWLTKIRVGGIIFLYLPHKSQTYWHPSSNRKHVHSFDGSEIGDYLRSLGHNVFVGGCDANHSFVVICEKVEKEPEFGSKEYYNAKAKVIADEKEHYCKEHGISYIREGNNVIYNEPSPVYGRSPLLDFLEYGKIDTNGNVLMKGCFDKSIKDNKFNLGDDITL